jgi:hypothetical protein
MTLKEIESLLLPIEAEEIIIREKLKSLKKENFVDVSAYHEYKEHLRGQLSAYCYVRTLLLDKKIDVIVNLLGSGTTQV